MAKRMSLNEKIARIRSFAASKPSAESEAELKKTLSSKNNLLSSTAAKVAGKTGACELIPELVNTFERYMVDPCQSDKGCLAKSAIIEALYQLDYQEYDIYLQAVRHFQLEASYGGPIDTAATMRGRAAQALTTIGYPDLEYELVNLLLDPETQARQAAVDAVAELGGRQSELLLRMKILAGDSENEITGMCFSGLMRLAPEYSLDFVAKFLDSPDKSLRAEAALAIGESRLARALEILMEKFNNSMFDMEKKSFLLPIALIRSEESFSFLLELLLNSEGDLANETCRTIKLYMDKQNCVDAINKVLKQKANPILDGIFQE